MKTLCGPVIIVEHSAQAAVFSHGPSAILRRTGRGENKYIADALMVSLVMIIRHKFPDGDSQSARTKRIIAENLDLLSLSS